jgi:flagellar motility protein MotE (MotC chaperone)
MIVTRRRERKLNLRPLLLPVIAIAALAVALIWPPSHKVIVDGPLAPVWSNLAQLGRPFAFAYQNQVIADRNREIKSLNDRLEGDRKTVAERDSKIGALQDTLKRVQNAPSAATPAPTIAKAARTTGLAAASTLGGGTSQTVPQPDDVGRVAAYWGGMEADKAAAIVQRLPEDYVVRVFNKMSPDQVGEILAALPAAVAARLSADRQSK